MDNFTPNSHKFKQEQASTSTPEKKKVEKVVSGTAKVKKKSELRKFTDVFVSEDAANVKQYILFDVVIPAAKKLVSDIVKDGIEMILYGGSGRSGESRSRASYVSYNRFSDRRDDRRSYNDARPRASYNYGEVSVPTRGDAEAVLDGLQGMIERYGTASVADMYELAGVSHNYTDNYYGWDNISTAEVSRTRDGDYLIRMPKAFPLR